MKTDTEILDWLERNHTLHNSVEFLYVVDGYEAAILHDEHRVYTATGESLREAISNLMRKCP